MSKCPESVPGVFGTPFRHSGDTLKTLFGHSGAALETPPRTLRRTSPVFGDTLGPRDLTLSGTWWHGRFATRFARIDSRESFAIETPNFIARQADSLESLEFPIRANHPIRAQ